MMKFVEIYKTENDGTQRVSVVCNLVDGRVICEGDLALVNNLESDGILDYSAKPRKEIYPKDGLKFLENLCYNFTSGYMSASEVREK